VHSISVLQSLQPRDDILPIYSASKRTYDSSSNACLPPFQAPYSDVSMIDIDKLMNDSKYKEAEVVSEHYFEHFN